MGDPQADNTDKPRLFQGIVAELPCNHDMLSSRHCRIFSRSGFDSLAAYQVNEGDRLCQNSRSLFMRVNIDTTSCSMA